MADVFFYDTNRQARQHLERHSRIAMTHMWASTVTKTLKQACASEDSRRQICRLTAQCPELPHEFLNGNVAVPAAGVLGPLREFRQQEMRCSADGELMIK